MADQRTFTRPRRSAAIEAQVKVEESYEIWGQPPPDNESRRATPGRKRSTTAEASTASKRRRTSFQHLEESGSPTVPQKTEAEDEAPLQPLKRGRGRPKQNSIRQQIPQEVYQATGKVVLRVPNSPTFKEALRLIWSTGEDTGPFADASGQAGVVETIVDYAVARSSTQATRSHSGAYAQSGHVPVSLFQPISPERPLLSKTGYELSVCDVQVQIPEVLQDDIQINTSSLGTEKVAAGSSEETTRLGATRVELEGTRSKSESRRGGGARLNLLHQLEIAAANREVQHPSTTSLTRAPPFTSEHTHPVSEPSSLAMQPPPCFASARELHDLVMSTFKQGQQQKPLPPWEPSGRDTEAIINFAAQMDREATLLEISQMSAKLDKTISAELRETLAQNGVDSLLYYFRTQAAKRHARQRMTPMLSKARASSGIREWARLSDEYALRTLAGTLTAPGATVATQRPQVFHGGTTFSKESSAEIQQAQVKHGDTKAFNGISSENQRAEIPYQGASFPNKSSSETQRAQVSHGGTPFFHGSSAEIEERHGNIEPSLFTHTTGKAGGAKKLELRSSSPTASETQSDLAGKTLRLLPKQDDDSSSVIHNPVRAKPNAVVTTIGDSDGVVLQRKPVSFHPPPMYKEMPNNYFDRNPQASSIGAHSFDPLVGLPDHSNPRTFHTPSSTNRQHLLDALQPTIDHFRQLTDGVEPREMPLNSGYEGCAYPSSSSFALLVRNQPL